MLIGKKALRTYAWLKLYFEVGGILLNKGIVGDSTRMLILKKITTIAILLIAVIFVQPQNVDGSHKMIEHDTLVSPNPILATQTSDLTFSIYQVFATVANPLSPGHVFVKFADYYYGFHPSKGKGMIPVLGKVCDDRAYPWNYKISWDITATQMNAIVDWINRQIPTSDLWYQLFATGPFYNCMAWAATVAASGGIKSIPDYITPLFDIPDPNTFGIMLKTIYDGGGRWDSAIVEKNPDGVEPSRVLTFSMLSRRNLFLWGF
jgi:hypothetical protein